MSLIFDLDCLRKDNDKKYRLWFNRGSLIFSLKLRWFSITWFNYDITNEYAKIIRERRLERESMENES